MDVTVLNLVGVLALGQRIVISLDGTIRVLQDGESLQPGDVILESPDESQISIKRFSPEDGSEVELEQDIANIFAALEEGQDPTELGEEFATEAGQNGSSISISATIERDGQETTPGTEFVTTGFEALGMSRTQSLSLLDAFRSIEQSNNDPTFVDNNNSPVGDTVSFTTNEDTPVNGTLSASDEDGDSLSFTKATDPSNGTVVVGENGDWTYTPNENYNGDDSFTVVVSDGQGGTDTITVNIGVIPVNDAPIGNDVAVTTDEDTPVSGSLNATDTDGDSLTFTKGTDPSNGSVVVDGNGNWTYTPDENYNGSDSFTVVISDGEGGTDVITVDVGVTPVPYVSITENVSVSEGSAAEFTVSLDKAADTEVTVNLTSSTAGANTAESDDIGNMVVTLADGVTAVTPNDDGSYTIPVGQTELKVSVATTGDDVYEGDETFSVSAEGGSGATGTATGEATIKDDGTGPGTPDNDKPVLSVTDAGDVNEGTDAVFTVSLSNETEAPVVVNLAPTTDGNYTAEANDLGDMVVTYVDGNTQTQTLTVDESGNVRIPAGVTAITVTVPTADDNVYEGDETFGLVVTESNDVTSNGTATGTATITDGGNGGGTNPDNDKPVLSVTDAGDVNEGTDAVFTVSLSNETEAPVVVNLAPTTDGNYTAEANDLGDMVVTYVDGNTQTQTLTVDESGNVRIPAGVTAITVTVPTADDNVYEGDETFGLVVTESNDVTSNGTATGTATITDGGNGGGTNPDNDKPVLSVTDAGDVNEGTDAVFTVSLSNETEAPVVVNLAPTTDGNYTAEANDLGDMVVTYVDGNTQTQTLTVDESGNVRIPAGVTAITVTVPTADDNVYEGDETFGLVVTESNDVTSNGTATGTATITDGGNGGGTNPDNDKPVLSVTDAGDVNEGTDAVFTVSLSNETEAPVVVNLAPTTDGNYTAEANDLGDMVVTYVDGNTQTQTLTVDESGNVRIPAGVTAITVTVPTADDNVYEGDETFGLVVTESNDVTSNGTATGTATITDGGNGGGTNPDNDKPVLSVTDAGDVNEGTDAVFTVSLSNETEAPVVVNLAPTTDGNYTAEANDLGDMVVTYVDGNTQTQTLTVDESGNVRIPAGVTAITVTVPTADDNVYEGDETFGLVVTESNDVTSNGTATGTATITDGGNGGGTNPDNDKPVLSVTDAGDVNEGTDAVFTVSLSNETEAPVVVNLAPTTDGNYTAEANDLGDMVVTYVDGNTQTQTLTVDESGNVRIPAGVTAITVTVPTADDNVYEGDETFGLVVTESNDVTSNGTATGTATITDGGNGGGTNPDNDKPVLSVTDAGDVNEGTDAVFTVSLSNETEAPVVVNLAPTTDGNYTAEANDLGDMVVTYVDGNTQTQTLTVDESGNVRIPAGVTAITVTVPTADDNVYEGDETFGLVVTESNDVTSNGTATGTATITDGGNGGGTNPDNDKPVLSVTDAGDVNEGTDAVFTVSLSNETEAPVVVNLAPTTDGNYTAEANDLGDMVVTYVDGNTQTQTLTVDESGNVRIPAGVTAITVTVPTADDNVYEGDETFGLVVTESNDVTSNGTATGTATITDGGNGGGTNPDNDKPVLSVTDAGDVNEGTDAVFTVSLSNETEAPVVVNLAPTTDGNYTAEANDLGDMVVTYVDGNTQTQTLTVDESGNVRIPAGVTAITVTVPTADDNVYEGDETFGLVVTESNDVTSNGTATGTATITDGGNGGGTNPDNDKPVLSVTDAGDVNEGTDAVFTVSLSNETEAPVVVNLAPTTDGNYTAEANDLGDMVVTYVDGNTQTQTLTVDESGNVRIPAGVTAITVTVPTADDNVYEGDETFGLVVTESNDVTSNGTATGTATITDGGNGGGTNPDNDKPVLSVTDAGDVNEGTDAVFTVSLSNETEAPVVVNLAPTTDGNYTAEANDLGDMVVTYVDGNTQTQTLTVDESGNVRIPAGVTAITVTVPTADDNVYEGDETFGLVVTESNDVTSNGTATGTATITDGGNGGGTNPDNDKPVLSVTDAGDVNEGTDAVFTVSLSNETEAPVVVNLAPTTDGNYTAEANDLGDMVVTYVDGNTQTQTLTVDESGNVRIPAGVTAITVTVPTADDNVYEGDETFGLVVTESNDVTSNGTATGTATITDGGNGGGTNPDNDKPVLSVTDAGDVNEGTDAVFTVSLSNETEAPVVVNLAPTTDGNYTAEANDLGDMVVTYVDGNTQTQTLTVDESGNVRIPAGVTAITVTVPTADDNVYEGDETFGLVVTESNDVTSNGTATGTATITDGGNGGGTNPDNDKPVLSVTDAGDVNEGTDAVFTVSLSNETEAPVVVNLAPTTDGNYTAEANDLGDMVVTYVDGNTQTQTLTVDESGNVRIPAGVTAITVTVPTADDNVYEGDETFGLVVTESNDVTSNGTATGTATITDGGNGGGTNPDNDKPVLSVTDAGDVNEGTDAVFTVSLSNETEAPVVVNLAPTTDGNYTAEANDLGDMVVTYVDGNTQTQTLTVDESGNVRIPAGVTAITVTVPTADDNVYEGDETFGLVVTESNDVTSNGTATGTATITDGGNGGGTNPDNDKPVLSVTDAGDVNEGTDAVFTVSLSNETEAPVVVNLAPTTDGNYTAEANDLGDMVVTYVDGNTQTQTLTVDESGNVRIPAGVTAITVTVPTADDNVYEGDETFGLVVTESNDVTSNGTATGTATITDGGNGGGTNPDNDKPVLSVTDAGDVNEGTDAVFTVSLSNETEAPVVVNLAPTTDGNYTAEANDLGDMVVTYVDGNTQTQTLTVDESGNVRIPAGVTAITVTVPTADDNVYEGDETFGLVVTESNDVTSNGTATGTATITDGGNGGGTNPDNDKPVLSVTDAGDVNEGTDAVFTVSLSNETEAPVVVNLAPTTDGNYTAEANDLGDMVVTYVDGNTQTQTLTVDESGNVRIPAGVTAITVTVPTADDNVYEGDETFGLVVTESNDVTSNGTATGTATITDGGNGGGTNPDNDKPVLSVTDAGDVNEGTDAVFTVSLSNETEAPVVVNLAPTTDGNYTAEANDLGDMVVTYVDGNTQTQTLTVDESGNVRIPAGVTAITVTVPTADDNVYEGDETFGLVVTESNDVTSNGTATGTATITDGGNGGGTNPDNDKPVLSVTDAGDVNEGTDAVFTVSLSNETEAPVVVNLAPTTDGNYTAEANDLGDMVVTYVDGNTQTQTLTVDESGNVRIPAGVTAITVTVPTADDNVYEGDETFGLVVTESNDVTSNGTATGTATITDGGNGGGTNPDNDKPVLSVTDAGDVNEGTDAVFTVSLSNETEAPVVVNLAPTTDGNYTAEANDLGDMVVTYVDGNTQTQTLTVDESGNVRIPAGVTAITVTVPTADDNVYEGDETFGLVVTESNDVTSNGTATGTATITDGGNGGGTNPDNDKPVLSVTDAGDVNEGTDAVFTVSLSNETEAPVVVNLAPTTDGNYTAEANDLGDMVVTYVDGNTQTQTLTVDESGNVRIPAGVTAITVTVPTADDNVYEGDETFGLVVTESNDVTSNGTATGTATITDGGNGGGTNPDNDKPVLSVTDAGDVNEGTDAVFTVSLSNETEAPVVVNLAPTTDGNYTAEANDLGDMVVTYVDGNTQTQTLTVDESGNVRIPAGVTAITVTVPTADDNVYEGDETFGLVVTESNDVTSNGTATGTATITDGGNGGGTNPDNDKPVLSVTDAGDVNEGTDAVFTVSLSNETEAPVVVNLAPTTDGNYTAEANDLGDMVVTYVDGNTQTQTLTVDESGNVRIPAGVTAITVTVPTADDNVYEGDETFGLVVTESNDVTSNGTATGTATITDGGNGGGTNPDNDKPVLSVTDAGDVNEGTDAVFTVSLSNETEAPVVVNLAPTTDGNYTAEANDLGDMVVTYVDGNTQTQTLTVDESGNVRIPAGVTAITVTVPTADDNVYEGDETFGLVVTESNDVTSNGTATGTATITDGGNGGGTNPDNDKPVLSVTDAGDVNEGTDAVFTVSLSNETEAPVVVNLAPTTDGNYTAEANDLGDMVVTYVDGNTQTQTLTVDESGNVRIPAGVTAITVTVPTADDNVYEGDETFGLVVTESNDVTSNGTATGTATITDGGNGGGTNPDNDKPVLSVTDAGDVNEGTDAVFTVSLSNETEAPVVVNLAPTTDGNYTAEANDLGDMVVTYVDGNTQTQTLTVDESGNVRIPAGVTAITVTVPTADDNVYEGDETFGLVVTESNDVTSNGTATGTATITDGGNGGGTNPDNDKPVLSVTDAGDVNEGTDAVFTVSLSNETEAPVVVNLAPTTDGNYTAEANDLGDMVVTYVDGNTQTQTLTVDESGNVRIPAGVTAITVTVPTADDNVYEGDETFGLVVTESNDVTSNGTATGTATIKDDDAPDTSNSHVVGIEDTTYTFKSSDFNVVDQDSSNLTIVITSEPASGTLYYIDGNLWVELTGSVIGADGYEITQSEIDSGKLVFFPISDESSTSMLDDEGTSGNNLGDYTEFNFYASDGVNVSGGSTMSIDISAVADAPTLTVNSDNVTAAIDFDDTNYSGSWGSVNINQVFGPGTVGEWHSSNGNRVEVGRESTYRSGGDSTNTVLEIEYNNVDDVVYTDIDVEQGQYYSFSFDISGRDNSISNGNSDLNVVWINMDTGQETVLYEFRPNDEDWLRDQTVVLPSDVGGNYRLLLVSADTQASSSVGAILDNLEIVKADSQGFEDSFIALPDFEAALNDIDSSEVLSLSLSGLPIGTQITDGSVTLVVTLNSGVDISSLDMDNLSVIVDVPGVYNYSITATATEVSNSDTASTTADLVLTVLELPQRPDVGTSEARIAEEGLLTGLQDDIGITNGSDLTNNSSYSGVISLQDNNGDMLEVSLVEPTSNIYTSNGTLVEWSVSSDGQTLIGSANTDANNSTLNETIITVVIDDDGNYNVELSSGLQHDDPSGEDIMSFEIPVKASDGTLTGNGSISIIVEDDSPESQRIHHDVVAETKSGANVQLVLDVSGSMKEDAGNGKSKLQVMKESTIQMLKQYESLGETRVQIVAFSDNYYGNQNAANYTAWISVTAAISYVNGLNAGGGTDYDDALWIANQTWDQSGRLSNASNISYFLSDGKPTGSDSGNSNIISQAEEGWWKTHLEQHDITAQSYGIGNNAPAEYLNPGSYDGLTDQDTEAIIVPDVTQLPPVLLQSLIQPIGGSLLSHNQGADDAVVSRIAIEGVTFNYNGSNVTSIGSNSSVSHTFDSDTKTLTIYIDSKHSLVIDLDDGGYQFFGAADNKPVELDFYYTVIDFDGDSSTSLLSFEIDGVNVVSDVNSEGDIVDHVRLNHYGHSSEELLWSQNPAGKDNQKVDGHKDGIVIDVGAAGDDVFLGEGDDTLYLGDSHTTLDNNANSAASINAANNDMKAFMSGGDLEHLQSPSDENSALNSLQFSSAHIDVGHSGAGGDHVYGQGGVDIIYGAAGNDVLDGGEGNDGLRGGSGEDRLTGGSGEDILIGGLGDDILTGGGGDDIFKFVDQDTSNSKIDIRNGEQDIITDFTKGEDKIDISDLLYTDSNDTIDSLLQANKVDLTLEASDNLSNADLKLTINDGGNSQEVIIQGVGSQFSDYIESGSITNVSGLLNDIINIPDINN